MKLDFPVGPNHEDPRARELVGDELEKEPGRVVSAVEIVYGLFRSLRMLPSLSAR